METLRFTRALFGLFSSPFLLGGVVRQHLENCRAQYPEIVEEIERSLYIDDLIGGGPTVEGAKHVKETTTDIFNQGGFTLHKWHSNAAELDTPSTQQSGDSQETYAKEQLGVPPWGKGALLGIPWNKETDTIEVKFPPNALSLQREACYQRWPRFMIHSDWLRLRPSAGNSFTGRPVS